MTHFLLGQLQTARVGLRTAHINMIGSRIQYMLTLFIIEHKCLLWQHCLNLLGLTCL